ncbi:MAG TPA: cysteine hydrolase family protein [Candidatus Brocadiia bacterium]|nr:cysteine hydrolase [Planctomycetota bacterium]MDO8094178.1 isochorismatase family cysteine hydrolase [Candidatus Brocadiales bacterium]
MNKEVKALLITDMLRDFIDKGAPLEVSGGRDIVANIQRQIENARKTNIPILYCCDRHKKDDPEFRIWPPHAVEGTKGADIIDELKPQKGDSIIPKTTYSNFFESTLDSTLRRLGVNHLILTGVCTNICILYTAVDAYMRGYGVTVPEDCVAALTKEDHKFALRQIKEVLKPRKT